jgi:glycosyltransferase involved in cell wall biosynthesis
METKDFHLNFQKAQLKTIMNEQISKFPLAIHPIKKEDNFPLWSVMIPSYNCAKYLREALLSVLAQDPGPDLMQIEVVDDCSTLDNPQAVVEEIGQGRITFYRQPQNVGHIKNFNTCIERSRGELIHILHGDDRVRHGFYHKMQQAFEQKSRIGAAYCRHAYIDETGGLVWLSQVERLESGVLENWLDEIATFNRLQTPSIVVHRKVYEAIGGFDPRTTYVEDWEMWVRIAAHYSVWYEVEPLAEYRCRTNGSLTSICRQKSQIINVRKTTEIMQSYLPQKTSNHLIKQARDNWAMFALDLITDSNVIEHSILAFITQICEALKCSSSPKILKATLKLLIQTGWKQLKQPLRYLASLFRKSQQVLDLYFRSLILRASIKHLYGDKEINYEADELIVLSVVRNGELYVKSFIEHYFQLGVRHIVLLDNGSTDNTVAIARQYTNVTILQTHCSYGIYETLMKKYLVQRFSKNRWNLFADIDELFDYPFSNTLKLKSLLIYLNKNSYTAVLCQMLDLFSDQPLGLVENDKSENLKEKYIYYDISNLYKEAYPIYYGYSSNKNLMWHQGGIRKTLFGTNNYLSKAALTFVDNKIELFVNCHQVHQARIADFTAVLLHYPFVSSFYEKVAEAVKTNRYALSASHEYILYLQRLEQDPNLKLKLNTACELKDINLLVEQDFLVISDDYQCWAKEHQPILGSCI